MSLNKTDVRETDRESVLFVIVLFLKCQEAEVRHNKMCILHVPLASITVLPENGGEADVLCSSDNLSSNSPDNYHTSGDVYQRGEIVILLEYTVHGQR